MMSGLMLFTGSSQGQLEVHHNVYPIREDDGGEGLEVVLMSPPWREDMYQGRPNGS